MLPEGGERRQTATDIALLEVSRRLGAIETKVDTLSAELRAFALQYARESTLTGEHLAGLRNEMDRNNETLYGRDGRDDLVTKFKAIIVIGSIFLLLYTSIMAPVLVYIIIAPLVSK